MIDYNDDCWFGLCASLCDYDWSCGLHAGILIGVPVYARRLGSVVLFVYRDSDWCSG